MPNAHTHKVCCAATSCYPLIRATGTQKSWEEEMSGWYLLPTNLVNFCSWHNYLGQASRNCGKIDSPVISCRDTPANHYSYGSWPKFTFHPSKATSGRKTAFSVSFKEGKKKKERKTPKSTGWTASTCCVSFCFENFVKSVSWLVSEHYTAHSAAGWLKPLHWVDQYSCGDVSSKSVSCSSWNTHSSERPVPHHADSSSRASLPPHNSVSGERPAVVRSAENFWPEMWWNVCSKSSNSQRRVFISSKQCARCWSRGTWEYNWSTWWQRWKFSEICQTWRILPQPTQCRNCSYRNHSWGSLERRRPTFRGANRKLWVVCEIKGPKHDKHWQQLDTRRRGKFPTSHIGGSK